MPQNKALVLARFDITINGSALPDDILVRLAAITVDDSLDIPGMFALEFSSADSDNNTLIQDQNQFDVGNEVVVKMGYEHNLQTVITGEITGLEPDYRVERLPGLIVRGYDRRHRLQRGRKVRSFLKQKDSEIAQQIAQGAGLSASVQDSKITHDYVLQSNQTDMEFLQERARRIGFEMKMKDKTLSFRPVAISKSPELTLTFQNDLIEFHPRLSSVGQVSEVTVQGWDPKTKAALVGNAESGAVDPSMAGENGASLASSAFGQTVGLVTDTPLATKAEADELAKSLINLVSLSLIVGEGVCNGRPELASGKVINVTGLGKRFSGPYYVTSVSHRYSVNNGYATHFTVRRNAL
jgi:phage protein D